MKRRVILILISAITLFILLSAASLAARMDSTNTNMRSRIVSPGVTPEEWCQPGIFYMLGEKNPINVYFTSANYSMGRIKIGTRMLMPPKGQKYLVVHHGLQNPVSTDKPVNQSSVKWTLTADGRQISPIAVGVQATWAQLNHTLKPSEKLYCYAVFAIGSKVKAEKVVATNSAEATAKAAQFDLRSQVQPLKPPYTDSTGYVLLDQAFGVMNTKYMLGVFDINVTAVAFPTGTFAGKVSKSGRQMTLVTVEFTNNGIAALPITANTTLGDSTGLTVNQESGVYAETSDTLVTQKLAPNQKLKVRLLYMSTQGSFLRNLTFKNTQGPDILIDLKAYHVPGSSSGDKTSGSK